MKDENVLSKYVSCSHKINTTQNQTSLTNLPTQNDIFCLIFPPNETGK